MVKRVDCERLKSLVCFEGFFYIMKRVSRWSLKISLILHLKRNIFVVVKLIVLLTLHGKSKGLRLYVKYILLSKNSAINYFLIV